MATLSTLVVRLIGDVSDFQEKMEDSVKRIDKLGKNMKEIGQGLTTRVTLPLVGVGAAAIAAGTQLNAGMANVASLGVASERVTELKSAVQEMAIDVGKSTGDLADGLYQVISAFGDSADTVAILETNSKAAAAGLATTTDAINLTSAVTKGYGDVSAEAVRHAADLAFQTVRLGQTTFPELAAAIGAVVPISASLGVAQEELFAIMATGTGVTGSASEVATQFRGILQALMAPTKSMSELLEEMGYQSGQAMLEQLGLQGTIEAIVQAAEASNQPLQSYISSIEGQTLALALAGPQAETFTQKLAAMQEATGATEAAFAAQTQGINANGFAMQQLAVKTQVLLEKLGDGLAPALTKALDAAEPLIDALVRAADWFSNLDSRTQTTIVTIAALVAGIGPLLMVLGAAASGISAVMGAVGAMSGAMAAAGPVIGAITAAIGAIGAPVLLVIGAIAALALAWKNNWFGIRDLTKQAVDAIIGFFSGLPGAIAAIATRMWEGLKSKFNEVVQGVRDFVGKIRDLLPGSDAKAGPLSDLFASGRGLPATLAAGIRAGAGILDRAVTDILPSPDISLSAPSPSSVPFVAPVTAASESVSQNRGITVIINNPTGEPSETSIRKQLQTLSALGVLEAV
jgi:TP901 family phage tail tape measure protein